MTIANDKLRGTPTLNEVVAIPAKKAPSAYSGTRKCFIAVVCAQILTLVGFAAPKALTLYTGKTVCLQASPVDPYDVLRGEFADLQFKDVSDVASSQFAVGDQLYASLVQKGDHWVVGSVSKEQPSAASTIAMKGIVDRVEIAPSAGSNSNSSSNGENRQIHLCYGIERLYTPEGKSANLETSDTANKTRVDVSVDSAGNSAIKRVAVAGKEIYNAQSFFNSFH